MLRIGALLLSISALFVTAYPPAAQAQAAAIPAYFFSQWTVQSNCIQQGFDPAEQTQVGLQFTLSPTTLMADGLSYPFQAINSATQSWPDGWSELTVQYRAGVQMTDIPADFVCIPGQPASSGLLAMSNYTQSAEPYYEYEHWYGFGSINGEPHHFLVFPRNVVGTDSAIIVLLDAGSGNVVLDQDGTIHSENN
jgi:hypothetical protein